MYKRCTPAGLRAVSLSTYTLLTSNSECCAVLPRDFFFFTSNLPYVNFKQNQNFRSFLVEGMDGQEERGALKEGSDPSDLS